MLRTSRRGFLQGNFAALTLGLGLPSPVGRLPSNNKILGTISNCDNQPIQSSSGKDIIPDEFRTTIGHTVHGVNVLAYDSGNPDVVKYRSSVATYFGKYNAQVWEMTWPDTRNTGIHNEAAFETLRKLGTDPLTLAMEVCRRRGVSIVASYRMNSEDYEQNTYLMSDFGRAHPEWRIPGAGCLDPAIPQVYEYRLKIFTEVAERYDIDGIEFNFRRWLRMISSPLENYPILTKMVRETRQMLNATARKKRRKKLLLGARVGPSLADPKGTEYSGMIVHPNYESSCRELGLDVKTWIEEELVDYVCPSLWWPRWPGLPKIAEFVALAKNKNVGIYPTVFPIPHWIEEGPIAEDDVAKRLRYRGELGAVVLQGFAEGADGISLFNWSHFQQPGMVKEPMRKKWGLGCHKEQMAILPHLRSAAELRQYLRLA